MEIFVFLAAAASGGFLIYGLFAVFGREQVDLSERLGHLQEGADQGRRGREKKPGGDPLDRWIQAKLANSNTRVTVSEFKAVLFGAVLIGTVAGILFTGSMVGMGVGALAGLLAPNVYIARKAAQRRQLLESQLIDFLGIFGNSLRINPSLERALNTVASEMDGPIREEVEMMLHDLDLGTSEERALERWQERTGSENVRMIVTSLNIARPLGGDPYKALEAIQDTLKERVKLQGEIRIKTASGRTQATVISLMPAGLLAMMQVAFPDGSAYLFNTKTGNIWLGIGVGLNLIGLLVARKLATLKV